MAVAGLFLSAGAFAEDAGPIDWNKARELYRRSQQGEKLAADEQAYLDRAKEARKKQNPPAPGGAADGIDWKRATELYQKSQRAEKLSGEDQAYLDRAKAARNKATDPAAQDNAPAMQGKASTGLVPLTELTGKYKDQDGGLYGGGSNEPPAAHLAAAEKALAQIKPLDADGNPDPGGKIVLLSIGMSNTTMEFSRFKQIADADEQKSPQLVIVDCAQGGQAAAQWVPAESRTWPEAERRLKTAGVGARQVQVAWIKQANIRPQGALHEHAEKLRDDLIAALNLMKEHYPNLRVAYLSSRIYAGYATTPLNPEPYAYEGAFAVRWLIQEQIAKNPKLNADPAGGAVNAPLLLWAVPVGRRNNAAQVRRAGL